MKMKECALKFTEYLCKVSASLVEGHRDDGKDEDLDQLFDKIEPFLVDNLDGNNQAERSFEEFKAYFLEKNSQFRTTLNVESKTAQFQSLFFQSAQSLFKKVLEGLKNRLPWKEPGFTIVDCFELKKKKKSKTLENLCTLARRFDNIILPHEESDVNSEVETLENNYHQVRKRIKNSLEGS